MKTLSSNCTTCLKGGAFCVFVAVSVLSSLILSDRDLSSGYLFLYTKRSQAFSPHPCRYIMESIKLPMGTTVVGVTSLEKESVIVEVTAISEPDSQVLEDAVLETKDLDTGKRTVTIQVVDLENEPAEEMFPVSLLDCIMPRMLVPVTCTYQLDDGADKEALLGKICEGLRMLMGEYRFLAGALYEREDGGRPFVKRTASQATFDVHIQDMTITNPAFPSFAELAAAHFPASILDDRLLPQPFVPSPNPPAGEGVPAMVLQLNLIRGGLVMGMAIHHLLVDAKGLDALLARWAEHTRAIVDPTRFSPPQPLRSSDVDTAQLELGLDLTPGTVDCRKQAVPSLKYSPKAPPRSDVEAPEMAQHIWHIPASKLAALKASAVPPAEEGTSVQQQSQWVSTNDCITALMWRSIARARLAARGFSDLATDTRPMGLENSLDVRSAFGSGGRGGTGIPAAYVGNVVMFSKAQMPLNQLVAADTFRDVALKVRETIEFYRSWPTVRRAMEWIAALPRCLDVEWDFGPMWDLDMVTTSWRVLKYYERADFGFGRLMALRWATPVFDGFCFLYPTRSTANPDEGLEIYLGLEKKCMDMLLMDEELRRWAEVRD